MGLSWNWRRVASVGRTGPDVTVFTEGDHVTVPFTLGDGTCKQCRTGHTNTCENLTPLGFVKEAQGAFAETVDAGAVPNTPEAVRRRTGRSVDISVDALGIAETC